LDHYCAFVGADLKRRDPSDDNATIRANEGNEHEPTDEHELFLSDNNCEHPGKELDPDFMVKWTIWKVAADGSNVKPEEDGSNADLLRIHVNDDIRLVKTCPPGGHYNCEADSLAINPDILDTSEDPNSIPIDANKECGANWITSLMQKDAESPEEDMTIWIIKELDDEVGLGQKQMCDRETNPEAYPHAEEPGDEKQEALCVDNDDFEDADGFGCTHWAGQNCQAADLSTQGVDDLLTNCRKSCNQCSGAVEATAA
jgi:hypothetical protein